MFTLGHERTSRLGPKRTTAGATRCPLSAYSGHLYARESAHPDQFGRLAAIDRSFLFFGGIR